MKNFWKIIDRVFIVALIITLTAIVCSSCSEAEAKEGKKTLDQIEVHSQVEVINNVEIITYDIKVLNKLGTLRNSYQTLKNGKWEYYLIYKDNNSIHEINVPETVYNIYYKYYHEGVRR